MSSKSFKQNGNDTIDRYPLSYEGKLKKILCVTEEVFKNLRAALVEFGLRPKNALPKTKLPFQQKPLQKRPLGCPRSANLKPEGNKCIGSFEPSDLFTNKSSSFWREQNLKAWFKEQRSYEDFRYIKAYAVEF
jgi:hypothetical protein